MYASRRSTAGQKESFGPVMFDQHIFQTGPSRKGGRFIACERSFHGHSTIHMHHMASSQQLTAEAGQPVAKSGSSKVVDKQHPSGRLSHSLQQHDSLIGSQMMQKETAHDNVILWLRQRFFERIALVKGDIFQTGRGRLLGGVRNGGRTDITAMNANGNGFPLGKFCESNGEIAATGGDVKHCDRGVSFSISNRLPNSPPDDRVRSAPPVDST